MDYPTASHPPAEPLALDDVADATLNLSAQTTAWLDTLTAPIRDARDRMQALASRAEELKQEAQEVKEE